MEQMEKMNLSNNEKIDTLEKAKEEKEIHLQQLNSELSEVQERRMQLEYQLNIIRNEGELIEQEFKQKVKEIK